MDRGLILQCGCKGPWVGYREPRNFPTWKHGPPWEVKPTNRNVPQQMWLRVTDASILLYRCMASHRHPTAITVDNWGDTLLGFRLDPRPSTNPRSISTGYQHRIQKRILSHVVYPTLGPSDGCRHWYLFHSTTSTTDEDLKVGHGPGTRRMSVGRLSYFAICSCLS